MFAFDKALIVREGSGELRTYFVLEVTEDDEWVLVPQEAGEQLAAMVGHPTGDEAVDLIAGTVRVVRLPGGEVLEGEDAGRVLTRTGQYSLVLAGHRLQALPPLGAGVAAEALPLAFEFEVAKRGLSEAPRP